ncbi:hypothetical protein JCM8097_009576 [Rhodosporidiobolus ruineniae]
MHFSLAAVASALLAAAPALAAPAANLEERGVACRTNYANACQNVKRPVNSAAVCDAGTCSYTCNAGYTDLGNRCIKLASSTSSSASAAATGSSSTLAAADGAVFTDDAVAAAGVTGFAGNNTNAIISWYDTNSTRDSTNGHSWCGFPYDNNVVGFAPSLKTMLNNFNGSYTAAATAYCGLEAVITTPSGRNLTAYIGDAFDDTWVLTPSSIDLIHGAFPAVFGTQTENKNDVVQGAAWTLTGRRNENLRFKSTNSLYLTTSSSSSA